MKKLSVRPDALEIEYEGKVLKFDGEYDYMASINQVKWLPWDVPIKNAEAWAAWIKTQKKWKPKSIEAAEAHLAWLKDRTQFYDSDVPISVDEKLEIMRSIHRYGLEDESCSVNFVDDRNESIFFDPHGNPLVCIDGEIIRSAKVSITCICEVLEEVDNFSDSEFKLFQMYITRLVKNRVLRKVRIREKYGKPKEKWYECKTCKTIWRLVYPDVSFRGLWSKVREK